MKFIKVAAIILLIAILGCSFIACDSEKKTNENNTVVEKDTTPPPRGSQSEGLKEITVSFNITNSLYVNEYHVVNYTYKGFNPTIFGVLEYYFEVELGEYFATYEDEALSDMICWLGGLEAAQGQYWVAFKGTTFTDSDGKNVTVKNLLKNETLYNKLMIGSMSNYVLSDGESFTVVLAGEKVVEETPTE